MSSKPVLIATRSAVWFINGVEFLFKDLILKKNRKKEQKKKKRKIFKKERRKIKTGLSLHFK